MFDLGEDARQPSDFEHHSLFFRTIAYQQFIYQKEFKFNHLGRQFILFGNLPNNHFIKIEFRNLTGLSIEVFLELSLVLLMHFQKSGENQAIDQKFFSPLTKRYAAKDINIFLKIFTKSFQEIKNQINEKSNKKIKGAEYYEQTPFLNFPLIQNGTNFICIENHILHRCIEHFVYDRMRTWNAEKFMTAFGPIFEGSVEAAIKYSELSYISEKRLKNIFDDDANLIDFIIADGDSRIFVDAKAVEMAYQGKVSHSSRVIKDRSAHILKAIKQANEVMANLLNNPIDDPLLHITKNNYLIVVTYKNLNLGNGLSFNESIAKESLDKIRDNYLNGGIPLENMYFLNIDEFEILSEAIAKGEIGLSEGLEKAKLADSKQRTRKFNFLLHIKSWGIPISIPKYLQDPVAFELDKFKEIL